MCIESIDDCTPRRSTEYAGIAQLVERNFAKVKATGSSPVSRSKNKDTVIFRTSKAGDSHNSESLINARANF